MKIPKWAYKWWSSFLTKFGDIMFATRPPKVRASHIRQCIKKMRAGDLILRGFDHYLDGFFIKGQFSHTGVVLNKTTVVHAIAEGVCRIDIWDYLKECDRFILIRFTKLDSRKALAWARRAYKMNLPYDFEFNKRTRKAVYCHEFGARFLAAGGIKIFPSGNIIYGDNLILSADLIIYQAPTSNLTTDKKRKAI